MLTISYLTTLAKPREVVATPLTVFSLSLQNAKESDLGYHKGNLFYILCGNFDEKKMGVPPYPGVG